jgi:DNA repair exonuclease SbcCD ATPase subunit
MVEPGGSGFPRGFQKMVYDLMIQHPDEFKGFVGAMAPSTDWAKFNSFSHVIAEAAENKQLESATVAEAFKEIYEESSKKGDDDDDDDVKSINDDDFSESHGSDLSSDEGGEEEDDIAPLMSERSGTSDRMASSSLTPESPMGARSNFAHSSAFASFRSSGGASLQKSGGGDAATGSRGNLLSKAGNVRRQESMRMRSSIRMENTQMRSTFRQQSTQSVTESAEDALSREISYREKLEDDIDQLERMIDDQDDDIDELDMIVRKSKKKHKELVLEIKTKTRTILILEEKYALLKSELFTANKRANGLHVKLSEIEIEKDLDLSALESERYHTGIELEELRKLKSDNESISDIHTNLAEKDLSLMNLMAEMESIKSELQITKKERKTLEKALGSSSAASILAEESDAKDSTSSLAQSLSDGFAETLNWGTKKKSSKK